MAYPIITPPEGIAVVLTRYRSTSPVSSTHATFTSWRITGTLPTTRAWVTVVQPITQRIANFFTPLFGHTTQMQSSAFFAMLGGIQYQSNSLAGPPFTPPSAPQLPDAVSMVWHKQVDRSSGVGNGRITLGCIREDYTGSSFLNTAGQAACDLTATLLDSSLSYATGMLQHACWSPTSGLQTLVVKTTARPRLSYVYRRYKGVLQNRPIPPAPVLP